LLPQGLDLGQGASGRGPNIIGIILIILVVSNRPVEAICRTIALRDDFSANT
jgi:hypothetical protein